MANSDLFLVNVASRHQAHLERLKTHYINEYDKFLQQMAREIRKRLANKEITEFTRDRLEQQLERVKEDLREISRIAKEQYKEQIVDLAFYEAEFEIKTLSQIVDLEFALPARSQLRTAVFHTPMTEIKSASGVNLLLPFFDEWSENTIGRVNNLIMGGYYRGDTNEKIVRDIIGTKKLKFGDGELRRVRRTLEGVVRTAIQHAANEARQEVWKANSDIVRKYAIVATLDSKTSAICRSLDGLEFEIGKGPKPPFHPFCRTTMRAILDKRFSILEKDATRSQRDPETGKVSYTDANKTYYHWLKEQPIEIQDSIIGPTRGKLFREGGLTVKRFADLQLENFEPITLERMRELAPLAFKRAGL